MAKILPFEEFTAAYDDWYQKNQNLYQSELNALKSFNLSNKEGVEIGAGTGRFALPLGIKTVVEPSVAMAEIARGRGLDVHNAIAEDLPFEDETFDFVLMVTAICFFDDVAQAFKEAFRIIKPEGFIVIGFIDKQSSLGQIYEAKKDQSRFYSQATFYSREQVTEVLKSAGFRQFNYKQTLFTSENIIHEVKEGYGDGSFVVVKADKRSF